MLNRKHVYCDGKYRQDNYLVFNNIKNKNCNFIVNRYYNNFRLHLYKLYILPVNTMFSKDKHYT